MCVACGIASHVSALQPPAADGALSSAAAGARFAALKNTHCRSYLITAMLSMMADNIEHVITYWVLWETFHSPALAGFAVIAHWAPYLFFSVHAGALADRYDCRKVIQASQVLFMTVSAAWGVLFVTGTLQVWHAVILLLLHGFAGVLWSPGEQLMLHDMVGLQDLPGAIRLNSTFRNLGLLAGPAVGAALLYGLGPAHGIFVNVLIYVPMTALLLFVPYTGHLRDGVDPMRRPRMSIADAVSVIREVAIDPVLLGLVMLGGVSALLIGGGLQAQMPDFAGDLGTNAGFAYSMLLSANAAGAVLGGFLLEASGALKSTLKTALWSTVVWAGFTLAFAAANSLWLAVILLFGAGFSNLAAQSIAQTLVQLLAPPEKRGRVVGVYGMANQGLKIGTGVTFGFLGAVIGIHWSVGLSAAVLVVGVTILMLYLNRAFRRAPAFEAASL